LVISAGHETPSVNHEPRGLSINFVEILSDFPFVSRMRTRVETELPSLHSRRWTIRRKAAVLEALHSGALTLDEARERYALSVEKIRAWERQVERHGLYGLRATRVQIYRRDAIS
jgi:hypothetical protein